MTGRSINLRHMALAVYGGGLSPEAACEMYDIPAGERNKVICNIKTVKIANLLADRLVSMRATHPPYGMMRYSGPPTELLPNLHTKDFEPVPSHPSLRDKQPDQIVPANYADVIRQMGGHLIDTLKYGVAAEYESGNTDIFTLPAVPRPLKHLTKGFGTSTTNMENTLLTILKQYTDQTGELPTYGTFRRCSEGATAFILRRAALNKENDAILHEFFDHGYDHATGQLVMGLDIERERFDVIEPAYSEAIKYMYIPPIAVHTRCPAMIPLPHEIGEIPDDAMDVPIATVYGHYLAAIA